MKLILKFSNQFFFCKNHFKNIILPQLLLKVALSQKILENFYISNIDIPNHYPEQKIWIRCSLFLNFLLRIVIWSINSPVSSDLKPPLKVHTLCSCNPTTAFILWTIKWVSLAQTASWGSEIWPWYFILWIHKMLMDHTKPTEKSVCHSGLLAPCAAVAVR